ncbi:MAG: 1,4-alpha-glucan branching protein GlgB [Myxococcales bacterium]|nr:1,4-alpha-glucan branching protein GlgB [Myxococcales bacterium]
MEAPQAIVRLAQAFGLQVGYFDFNHSFRGADPEVVAAVVRALGGDPDADVDAQLHAREIERWRTVVDPVVVAWDGACAPILRLPSAAVGRSLSITIRCEDGENFVHELVPSACPVVDDAVCDGTSFVAVRAALPFVLPLGYHRLEIDGARTAAMVMSAPRRVWSPAAGQRHFGVFAPLYALRSERSLGVGDLTDLGDLFAWIGERGGSVVGTLPLLSAYLDEPCEASPYVPCSRLAWNELFLDLQAIPEFAASPEANALLASPEVQATIAALRRAEFVDHRTEIRLRRRLFAPLAARVFERGGPRLAALEAFAAARPELVDYARFRAAQEKFGVLWDRWPTAAAAGMLRDDDLDPDALRHHIFAQFCCHEQLTHLGTRAQQGGLGLYLDLPVGVHGLGFDPWRHRDVFVHGLATGAPPDLLFAGGQNWAFPPLSPDALQRTHHAYTIAMIRNHLRYAKVLRIDHVMGLHRLYVIPQGAQATDGIYLSYAADQMYAIFAIESHRSQTLLVGEDLGTVPPEVHAAMHEHGVLGMHVVEYAARAEGPALEPAAPGSVASINTHDMPTFAAFWDGDDIDDRVALGWIDDAAAAADHRQRARLRANLRRHWSAQLPIAPDADADAALAACIAELGRSEAQLVLVSLEDLWGERKPHNVPGTWLERPNWRRRARHRIDALEDVPGLADRVDRLRRARQGARATGSVRHDVSRLSADDLHWFNEGTHEAIADKLGAHPMTVDGQDGTYFAVWAPSASSVAVFGDFDDWDRGRHPLRAHDNSGIWEGFVPGVGPGDRYKFHVVGTHGAQDKADPLAAAAELPPRTASVVTRAPERTDDPRWLARRADTNRLDAPMSIYEVHLGSWRRVPEEGDRMLGYRELGAELGAYAAKMGFTHVELLPVMEHPFYGSWGYQGTGYFAPTARFGSPADFRAMVDGLHAAGVAVLVDWVPSHFPNDGHGLAQFDGTHLYEHADPRKGFHPDWQSCIFNYGRYEVQSFLISSALVWLDRYGVDGLRVDAVASMLYLDYSRKPGEWVPNIYGGRENLEAIGLLRRLNEALFRRFPGAQSIAEESTAWPMVSRPTWVGGLGFGLKWDMGWMHDTLRYMARDPIHRGFHQHELTFRMIYAFGENFVLPLSHDEVVHGKGSMLGKMPGDTWQRFANLRLLYGYMWGQPGKKLMFMGCEFAQVREWNHDVSLDWHLLDDPMHRGVQSWVADLNRLHRTEPALHELDHDPAGFEWVDFTDAANSVFVWLRRSRSGQVVLVVCNFTPVVRHAYRVGVPAAGQWVEIANSDAAMYGGSGVGNFGGVQAQDASAHGRPFSIELTLPPLGVLMFRWGEP